MHNTNEYLNEIQGKPTTGIAVSKRLIDLGRQRGNTTVLIEALPDNQSCVIVTGSDHVAKQIKSRLDAERPNVNAKFVIERNGNLEELEQKLKDLNQPVFIDNQYWEVFLRKTMTEFHNKFC